MKIKVFTALIVAAFVVFASCSPEAQKPDTDTPQEQLASSLGAVLHASECSVAGECVLLISRSRGYFGYGWTVYANCDHVQCRVITSPR